MTVRKRCKSILTQQLTALLVDAASTAGQMFESMLLRSKELLFRSFKADLAIERVYCPIGNDGDAGSGADISTATTAAVLGA